MKAINIHSYQFKKLERYELDRTIVNTECELYIINEKDKWSKHKELLKKFYITSGEYFSNKLYTINSLIDRKKEINIEELVYPTEMVILDGELVGFVMPFIEQNINFDTILKNKNIDAKVKIDMLKQVGKILNKTLLVGDLFLGDIHEANFIYDLSDFKIKAVDLDSVKIGNNNPSVSKFMTFNENLWDYPHKYPMDEDDIHIPNKNTTYLCYTYMILNLISQAKAYHFSLDKYYDYLQFLIDKGVNQELIEKFSYIYMSRDNVDPLSLLDLLPSNFDGLSYNDFEKKLVKC